VKICSDIDVKRVNRIRCFISAELTDTTDKRDHFTDDTKKEKLIPFFSYDDFIREIGNCSINIFCRN